MPILFPIGKHNQVLYWGSKAKQFAVTTSTGLYMTRSTNVHNYMYKENRQLVVAWEAGFFLNFAM
jgi:hypothetical protein